MSGCHQRRDNPDPQLKARAETHLLLRAHFLITGLSSARGQSDRREPTHSVLPLQRRDEPLQHPFHTVLRGRALGDRGKKQRVLAPVRRELGQRHGRQDDWWVSDALLYARSRYNNLHGGAVIDDRSLVMLARDLMKLAHPAFCSWGTSAPEPWSAIVLSYVLFLERVKPCVGCWSAVEVYGQMERVKG